MSGFLATLKSGLVMGTWAVDKTPFFFCSAQLRHPAEADAVCSTWLLKV